MKIMTLEQSIAIQPTLTPQTSLQEISRYDRRYMPRWPMESKVYYRIKGVPVIFKTRLRDLNPAGAALRVSSDVHPAQRLELKIYLPDNTSFETEGDVMWKRGCRCFHAGVLFDCLPQETQEHIVNCAYSSYEALFWMEDEAQQRRS